MSSIAAAFVVLIVSLCVVLTVSLVRVLCVPQVVQEYNAGDTVKEIRTIGQKNKYAERTAEQVILGASNNTVFSLDPRQQGSSKLAEHKAYKTVPKFSSIASTAAGDVAVGSDDGQIRLYNSISKVAKTCLPGLGGQCAGRAPSSSKSLSAHRSLILSLCLFLLLFRSHHRHRRDCGRQLSVGHDGALPAGHPHRRRGTGQEWIRAEYHESRICTD